MDIRIDDLSGPAIHALLQAHLDTMAVHSPPESRHALNLDGLRAPEITFWCVWEGAALIGCGALKQLDATHGEIKSMHTAIAHRGKGVATRMVEHILAVARERGYTPGPWTASHPPARCINATGSSSADRSADTARIRTVCS
jgi:putative acetyltransferase